MRDDAVARSQHIWQAGLHGWIDLNRTSDAQARAGCRSQLGIGSDAGDDQDHVGHLLDRVA